MALRKELLHMWANADPDSLSVSLVDQIVAILAPPLAERLTGVAQQTLPETLHSVGPQSLLPEAPERAAHGGGMPREREELLEELRGFMGAHNVLEGETEARAALKRQVGSKLAMSHPWQRWLIGNSALLLPAGQVLSFCAMVAPIFLAAAAGTRALDLVTTGASESAASASAVVPAAEAAEATSTERRFRRRIFALEREGVARERAEKERRAAEQAEKTQATKRVMDINSNLEAKLKSKTDELKWANQRMGEAQRSAEDSRSQLAERKKEVSQLRYQLEQRLSDRRSAELWEKERNRAMLRSVAREEVMRQHAAERAEKLRRCLGGEAAAELLQESEALDASQIVDGLSERLVAAMEGKLAQKLQEAARAEEARMR